MIGKSVALARATNGHEDKENLPNGNDNVDAFGKGEKEIFQNCTICLSRVYIII